MKYNEYQEKGMNRKDIDCNGEHIWCLYAHQAKTYTFALYYACCLSVGSVQMV